MAIADFLVAHSTKAATARCCSEQVFVHKSGCAGGCGVDNELPSSVVDEEAKHKELFSKEVLELS